MRRGPAILANDPWKLVLLLPALPAILGAVWHDATISVLRAYSVDELTDLLQRTPCGELYEVFSFDSPSFAEWLSVPALVQPLKDPVLRFFWAVPPGASNRVMHTRRLR